MNSEGCGTVDPDLGYEIVMRLFETLPQCEDRPVAIIFLNTAMKLLAGDSPLLPRLRRLEEKGTELLAGRWCATEFRIADDISVGRIASVEDIMDNDVISL
ncbi:hypothetical protein ACFLWG_03205 [Chloroflexota bacterium]